jgi:ABC transporter with metal-binding/Fe-S-binding domain ATP-binding protein
MTDGAWVSLFSGGKDSAWALYRALEFDLDVRRLLTVHPTEDSYLYHVPVTHLVPLVAESIDIPLVEVQETRGSGHDSTERATTEIEPLEVALRGLDEEIDDGLAGIIAGAIESEYQFDRLVNVAERLDIDLFAPIWQADPIELGYDMLEAGFEILIVQVAARGLDETWLGRTLDEPAFETLLALNEQYGVHVLGEGGEFETLVVDAPYMSRGIDVEYETVWDGTRGHIEITAAERR